MKELKEVKDLDVNSFFTYKGKKYEATSTTLTGAERRVYNHTDFKSELLPVHLKVKVEERKLFTDLYTVEEFAAYYRGAGRRELKARLKHIGEHRSLPKQQDNERKAIKAYLM